MEGSGDSVDQSLTQFIDQARAGEVETVEVDGRNIDYSLVGDNLTYTTRMERGDSLRDVLQDSGVDPQEFPEIKIDEGGASNIMGLFINFLPVIIVVGILLVFLRQAQKQQQNWRTWPFSAVSDIDPVCGNKVTTAGSGGSSTFQNVTYKFCSAEHKQAFDADPIKYLLQK
jgi:YHS domain-containing protein/ATP-dependent Zn protease